MKKITSTKTLSIRLTGRGKYYLPDDLTLRNKKIISIVPVLEMYSFTDNADFSPIYDFQATNIFINLTCDGQNYIWQQIPITQISYDVTKGIFEEFNKTISFPDSYLEVTADVSGNLILVVIYEDKAYSNFTTNENSNYEYIEVPLLLNNGYRNQLPVNNLLRDKFIKNTIVSFPEKTPQGYDGIERDDIIDRAYITLCCGSQKIIDTLPIRFLEQIDMYRKLSFDNLRFDFENSYIQIFGTQNIDNKYLYLAFEYER